MNAALHDYSHAEARDQLLWFIEFWPGTEATSSAVDQMLRHFEGFDCDPPSRLRRGSRCVCPTQ